jgi:phosphonate transport system permease protein
VNPGATDLSWDRFTPVQRALRTLLLVLSIACVIFSARHVEVIPEFLLDAPEQIQDLLQRMWPIDFDHYADGVHDALVDTLHIATLGTLLALLIAVPVGILATHRLVPWAPINWVARVVLITSRSVNSLIWALLFVGIFGPGSLAGTAAIALRSVGFMGKLIGESLEECDHKSVEAIQSVGGNWLTVLLKAYWPQVQPSFWSVLLFRWDINIRETAVLGLVGAGGIGMALDTAMNLFRWEQVSLILLSIFLVVLVVEALVTQIRRKVL